MGMDGVEIVMAVEDAFDIHVSDAEAEILVTPGQLIELVQKKVAAVNTDTCLNHRAFNWLRQYLVARYGLARTSVKPTKKLGLVIPKSQRKVFLNQIVLEIGADRPPLLERPLWLKVSLLVLSIVVGVFFAFRFGADFGDALGMLFLGVIAAGFLGAMMTLPLRTEFPKEVATAGDMALWIRRRKKDLANISQKKWTRDQIASRVREIVIEVLGCESQYREDARFVEDLGLS